MVISEVAKADQATAAINSVFSLHAFWPPPEHVGRLNTYRVNQLLYDGKHRQVFTKLNKIFHDYEAEHQKLVLVFNFHQRLSTLWADLTFGEHPIVKIDDKAKSDAFRRLSTESNDLWQVCYQIVIDLSRFGDAVFRIWYDEIKGARIEAISPQKWFEIKNPFTEEVLAQVIAYEIDQFVDHIKITYVKVEIHTPGQIENRMYATKEGKLALELDPADFGIEPIVKTDVDFMLVFPISKETTTTDEQSQDDYRTIDSLIEAIEMRYTRMGRILDYHSEPDKGVPETAFELDDNGRAVVDGQKKTWPIREGEPLPQYITWSDGGSMQAGFTHIDKLMERLYEVSETCRAAFDVSQSARGLSGTAIRLMLSIPLKKSKRVGSIIYPVVPQIIKAATGLEVARGFKDAVEIDDFTFTPQDGLPKDQTETINNMVALKHCGGVTDERMQHEIFGLAGEELQAEITKLKAERQANAANTNPTPPKISPEQTPANISAQLAGGKPGVGQ
jgi:hypothetical protein